MSDITTVDARGLSCPQPPMLALQAMKKLGKGEMEVLVDTVAARENVSRAARNAGWEVTVEEQPGGNYRIVVKK